MTTDPLERLHVDAPTLEPDPVLLSQLAAASSAASAPARPGLGRRPLPTMLLAAAGVAAVAVMAWGVSQIPGGGSPAPHPVQSPGRDHQVPSRSPESPDRGGAATPRGRASEGSVAGVPTTPAPGSSPSSGPGHRDHSNAMVPPSAGPGPDRAAHNGHGRPGDHNRGKHNGRSMHREVPGRGDRNAGHGHGKENPTDP